jgi:hypothetical protein
MISNKVYDAYALIQKHQNECYNKRHKCKYAKMQFTISSELEMDGIPFIVCRIDGKSCKSIDECRFEIKDCPKCKGKGYIYKKKGG